MSMTLAPDHGPLPYQYDRCNRLDGPHRCIRLPGHSGPDHECACGRRTADPHLWPKTPDPHAYPGDRHQRTA